MGTQTATTGNLENAQNIIIAQCKYTAEFNAPCANLVENFKLGKGNKQLTIPKVGAMEATTLTDGIDMTSSEEIGLTTTDLTTGEVGLKVILTYKLVDQFNEDVFRVIGRQMGDAMARKRDEDVIALFSALNASTTLGADNKTLTLQNASACAVHAMANKFPPPVSAVHHPNALGTLAASAMAIGAVYYAGIMPGLSDQLLRNYWKMNIDGINFFQDGNIAKVSGADSGYGAIFSKSAMAVIEGWAPMVEREKDISLRGHEVVMTSDYGCFEIDDSYGAPLLYEIGALTTTN